MPGPVPNRSDQRRRRNKEPGGGVTRSAGAEKVVAPPAEPHWHSLAVDWYESLAKSGQSAFYEPSDWATARYVAEAMSRNLENSRFSAQLFAAVMAASTTLLVTEGDRRRLRVELERAAAAVDADEEAAVAELDEWRDRLSG